MKNRRVWLGLAVSLVFLALFFRQVDLGSIRAAFAGANYTYVLPAVLLYFLGVFLRTVRWQFILAPLRRLSLYRLFSLEIIGYLANDILPARIGELVRAFILGEKEQLSKTAVLATIVVERIFDGLALVFLLLLVAAIFGLVPSLQLFLAIAAGAFTLLLGVFIFVASSRARSLVALGWLLRLFPARFRPRLTGLAEAFIDGLASMQSPLRMFWVFVFSTASWVVEAATAYVLVFSFPFRPGFHALVAASSVGNLGTTIPSGPGGVGTYDALVKETLVLFGSNADVAAAYTILLHIVVWLPVVLLGFVFLWLENLSLAQVTAQGSPRDRPLEDAPSPPAEPPDSRRP